MSEAPEAAAALGPVVIGYDGTDCGEDALALGIRAARVLDVTPIVVTVHPEPAEWVANRHEAASEILDRAMQDLGSEGVRADFRLVASTSAAHGLHDLAEEVGAVLVAVGSSGKAADAHLLAGSTAARLLSGSSCPVGVAPRGMRLREAGGLHRIGVGYLDTPEAFSALDMAARLARRTGAALRVLTVMADQAGTPLIGADAERAFSASAHAAYQKSLDAAIAELPAEIEARAELLTGDVVELLAALDEDDVDVLICGSRGYGPVRRVLLGGVASRLVRQARSPVVIVPRGD
jgi:nucleotide-binding universal stress UspA family protein